MEVVSENELKADYETPPYLTLSYFPDPANKPIPPLGNEEIVYLLKIQKLSGDLVKSIPIKRVNSCRFQQGLSPLSI